MAVDCQELEVSDTSVKQRRRAILAALLPLLLGGCWNGRILLTFEQPFWSAFGGDGRLSTALAVTAAMHGYLARVETSAPSSDPLAPLVGSIASGEYAAVVVGPLLSFQWPEYVPRFPETRFVLIDAPAPAQGPPANAVFLTFDRTGAFREAGSAAAGFVRARAVTARADYPAPNLASRIALLTSGGSGLSGAETEAFARGVAESLDGGRPVQRTLPSPVDANSIKAAVEEMRRAGADVFLLGLGEHDPAGLEVLRDAGGLAVVADWQASGALAAQVLVSVEADIPGGITLALDALRTGVTRVQGPVRLVSGKKI